MEGVGRKLLAEGTPVNEVLGAKATLGSSVLSAIGRTPLIELSRVGRGLDGRILAKLEYMNPGGSKKDRIALRMIADAERSGELRPGQPVVELTSGNTGTGLGPRSRTARRQELVSRPGFREPRRTGAGTSARPP